jgi:natural product precursor
MKKVKLNSKLQLNKETIAKLDNSIMKELKGGKIATQQITYCVVKTEGTVCK